MKGIIEKATCVSCERTFWATEASIRRIQAGLEESLCQSCSFEPAKEGDDTSEQFDFVEPEPMEGLV